MIQGNVDNIFRFDSRPQLAQAHFIYAREAEIKDAKTKNLAVLLEELSKTHKKYKILPSSITTKNVEYLRVWEDSLK